LSVFPSVVNHPYVRLVEKLYTKPINVKIYDRLRTVKVDHPIQCNIMTSSQNSRWRMAANMKIVMSAYLNEKMIRLW